MRVAFVAVLLCLQSVSWGKSFAAEKDGIEACVRREILLRSYKAKVSPIVINSVEYSPFWDSYSFTAEDADNQAAYHGEIYITHSTAKGVITCDLDFRPNWIFPNPWYVFALYDEDGRVLASRNAEIRVKGKRYRF